MTFQYGVKFGSDAEAKEAFQKVAAFVADSCNDEDRKLKGIGVVADACRVAEGAR